MISMTNRFWLSYDLGLRGDYEPLYAWLDEFDAKDCGDSTATFTAEATREEIAKKVTKVTGMRARLYLIGKNKAGKVTGGFIAGRRKAPPWTGLSSRRDKEEEEEA